jgi:hypothetical protein
MPIRGRNRSRVNVEAMERRVREAFGHDERGSAVTAPDIGNRNPGFQFVEDAFQRRYPIAAEIRFVAGPEKSLRSAEEAVVVLAPRHAGSRPKALRDQRLIV